MGSELPVIGKPIREGLRNDQAPLVRLDGRRDLAVSLSEVADPFVRNRQIPLAVGVSMVARMVDSSGMSGMIRPRPDGQKLALAER